MINIFNHIISKEEKNILLDWIYENEDKFTPNPAGPERKFYSFGDDPTLPQLFLDVKKRILKRENIKPFTENPYSRMGVPYKDYIGWVSEGGHIHPHQDPTQEPYQHIRYNLFLSTPKKGGIPIYNYKRLRMRERSYLRCNSGNEVHGCDFVEGNKPRIVVSYGVLI
jgi:hypothetical protein